ncbi:MAG TPA: DegT/DnrJ/EryC1/StrS family aminotransferase [Candidatus Nanoarchaeia archaeon]|nr:DegT/DnrJ/EryC1/StrS family aminotransferase [Candidatus Nanoarchaeia archaeon]
MIPLFKPSMGNEEIKAVTDVIKSGWVGMGPKTQEFEENFAKFIGTKYAVGFNSCTAALHLAVKVLNLEPGSEIITTPMTFVSTAFAADYNGLTPVFADIERDTLNIDPKDIERKITKKTRAIIPVHFGGHACKIEEIMEIAKKHNLHVIEDAAHATGSEINGKKLGTFGEMSCFSFHAVKNMTIGDGGMLVTNHKKHYERIKRLVWCGIDKSTFARQDKEQYSWDYDVKEIGYKFHLNDILSSIGIVQLGKLEKMNDRRRQIWNIYSKAFKNLNFIECPVNKKGIKNSCHNYVAKIKTGDRNSLISYLKEQGVTAGVHYKPVYLYPVYNHIKSNCPVTNEVWTKLITLPVFPDMTDKEVNLVIEKVIDWGNKNGK